MSDAGPYGEELTLSNFIDGWDSIEDDELEEWEKALSSRIYPPVSDECESDDEEE